MAIKHTSVVRGILGSPGKYEHTHVVDPGWRDIVTQIVVRGTGSTDPTWAQIGGGNFFAYTFDINDRAWMGFHVPHDIVPGSDIHFHAHWLPSGTDPAVVKWEFAYTYAKGFNQEAMNATGTIVTAEQLAPGVALQHMVTETDAVTIPGLTEPDGIIYCRIRRITNGGTDNTDTIFLLTTDVHYLSNSLATPNKAPDFYAY